MVRRRSYAATMGAPNFPEGEEFVYRMVRRRSYAATRGAPKMSNGEGFVGGIAQSRSYAATRGAPKLSFREGFVGGIVQSLSSLLRAKWKASPNPPRDVRPRPLVPLPEGTGGSECTIRKQSSLVPLIIHHPPFFHLPRLQTSMMMMKSAPGFGGPVARQNLLVQVIFKRLVSDSANRGAVRGACAKNDVLQIIVKGCHNSRREVL
jgi:hypothetical protein